MIKKRKSREGCRWLPVAGDGDRLRPSGPGAYLWAKWGQTVEPGPCLVLASCLLPSFPPSPIASFPADMLPLVPSCFHSSVPFFSGSQARRQVLACQE